MELKLHANATTTPRTRAYIQSSPLSVALLSAELGVSQTTIRRWRGRRGVSDGSHVPKRLQIKMSALEQQLVCELRRELALPLDDITEVMRRCVNAKLSRSAIHRCLRRNELNRRPPPQAIPAGRFEATEPGFVHVDLKHLPALKRRKAYAFVAIERTTRYVYIEMHERRDGATSAACLERFLAQLPIAVHTILSDNGSEFTDRFAVDMKGKPVNQPSGNHPFDRVCASHGIEHRLTKPYHPQTNGMVERFNRRLAELLRAAKASGRNAGRNKFLSHAQRNAYLLQFVDNYNRTRLKALNYSSPADAITNLTEHHTFAGVTLWIWGLVHLVNLYAYDLPHQFRLTHIPPNPW